MPVPEELVDAIGKVLDEESKEQDSERRIELLAKVRVTLDAWERGDLTTEDAVSSLAPPRSR
jgi:hypothetical protein